MALTSAGRHGGHLLLALVVALAGIGSTAANVMAASPSVTIPTAEVVFLERITFTGDVAMTTDVARLEIVIDIEGATRALVADVPTTVSSGPAKLTWVLKTPGGFLLPNTDVTARFRLTLRDGSSVLGPSTRVHYDDTRFAWKTVAGDFVTVHWVDGGQTFGLKAMQIGDDAVRSVSALLGVTERDPIDFYIYGTRTAFYDVLGAGTRENVGGESHPDIRTLFANISPGAVDDPWVGIVIPHELTHLVFDSAAQNPYHDPLHWINEGIAVYLSQGYGSDDRAAVRSAVQTGTLMPLGALAAQFPTTRERFFLAYSESVAAVSYLVETYGRDAMVKIVRSYGTGVSDDEAFTAALGVDVAGFEAAWLNSIGAPTPSPFGPRPAPAGPVPVDWGGAGPTPGRVGGEPSPVATSPGGPAMGGSKTSPTALFASVMTALAVVAAVAFWARRRSVRRRSVRRLASMMAAPVPDPAATSPENSGTSLRRPPASGAEDDEAESGEAER